MSCSTPLDAPRAGTLQADLQLWTRFALHAFLKFMLPPGLSPEVAVTWARHLLDMAPLAAHMLRSKAAAPVLA